MLTNNYFTTYDATKLKNLYSTAKRKKYISSNFNDSNDYNTWLFFSILQSELPKQEHTTISDLDVEEVISNRATDRIDFANDLIPINYSDKLHIDTSVDTKKDDATTSQEVLQMAKRNNNFKMSTNSIALKAASAPYDLNGKYVYYRDGKGKVESIEGGSKRHCTAAVRSFYDHAGISLMGKFFNHPDEGKATGSRLDEAGFKKIWHGTSLEAYLKEYEKDLQPGDIMIEFAYNKEGKPTAHGALWTGKEWISDFKQGNKAWVYGKDNGRMGKDSAILWRLK